MPEIIFEDDFILLINKPSGLLSVPGKTIHDSAWTRMAEKYEDLRMVHRLDCDTSGLMLFAKCREAQSSFGRQFQEREVSKVYQAVVSGHLFLQQSRVDLPLICDWPNRPLQQVNYNYGKPSQTDWQVLEEIGDDTLVELTPITGRSHQLRVHMKSIGHAIIGDRFYAAPVLQEKADRLMLHAWRLDFNHPIIGDRMSFQCDWNITDHLVKDAADT
jgi:tRNA pseudouridine32 synthase/23S rRNA pseudouridine746 synthase